MTIYKPRVIQINDDNTFAIACTSPDVAEPPRVALVPADFTPAERASVVDAIKAFRRVYTRRVDGLDLADQIARKEAELTALKAAQAAVVTP